jgi:hypothetical protein
MNAFTESVVEQAALAWLESAGWTVKNGAEIAPGEPAAERDDYGQAALATYTESGGTGRTALDQNEAVAVMLEKHEVCSGLFHGFNRSKWMTGTAQERLGLLPPAQEHILKQENGKDRCLRAVRELSQAFALAVPHDETIDWTLQENVRAQLRVLVKRILRKHGYPPDRQENSSGTPTFKGTAR